MSKKVLMIRMMPYDFDPNSYNVQEIGIGTAFCKLGYDFDYITAKKSNPKEWIFYEYGGHTARWIEKPRFRILRMGINLSLCDEAFLSQYDIILCREHYQIMTYLVSKKAPNVTMYSGPYWNMFMIPFMSRVYDKLFVKKMDKQIRCKLVKSDLAKTYLEEKGFHNIHTVGVALDTSRFEQCTEMTEQTKQIVSFMHQNPCILYVGTLDANKNYPFLLKVYQRLLEDYPELKFVVIGKSKQTAVKKLLGKADDSFEKDCYRELPEHVKNGIYRVQYIDNPQLKYVYPLAKAFLLPSICEIFGMVLLEAMYLGAPVVTSKHGGSVTLIKGQDTGKMIPEFDVEKWALAVEDYLKDPLYTVRITENAHRLVKDKFNWDEVVKEMLNAMQS